MQIGGLSMGRNCLDFKELYENKILGLDPGWGSEGGTGYAIINLDAEYFGGTKNKPIVDECGLITTFASDSRLATKEELCEKAIKVWKANAGFIRQPYALIIDKPLIYPGSPVRYQTIVDLSELAGMLGRCFRPKIKITPFPREWKGNQAKNTTQESILGVLDIYSKNNLSKGLVSIPKHKHHNIFDAIGIGFYGAEIISKQREFPANNHCRKS